MKGIYFAMGILAATLYAIADTIWKYKFHGSDLSLLDIVKFWALPTGILVAVILSYSLSGIGKLVALYPLKETDLSVFLPMVIILTIVFLNIIGFVLFKEGFTPSKAAGILLAIIAVYLLR